MIRDKYLEKPRIINKVQRKKDKSSDKQTLQVATRNKNKLKEYKRILTNYEIEGIDLKVPEIQSLDPYKVAEAKARMAWEKNDFNPIVIEDVSLEMMGLASRPGTYIADFGEEVELRRLMAEVWLKGKDRRAFARTLLGIYDGNEFHYREGITEGRISKKLKGAKGFYWDDMFIPKGDDRTFAQMDPKEKDKYSMRKKALLKLKEDPFVTGYNVFMLPEPFESEMERVRYEELDDTKARKFAYSLECLKGNRIRKNFKAVKYKTIERESNKFFERFNSYLESQSLGLIFTSIDKKHLRLYENGNPYIWQMGPKRRKLALAQRAEYFLTNQDKRIHEILDDIDKNGVGHRRNKRSITVDKVLGSEIIRDYTSTKAIKEIGYKKLSSKQYTSRTYSSKYGLFNKIGKYARNTFGIGSMPPVSGWRDVLVTSAIGHIPVFTHRNSLNAAYPERQIDLIKSAKKVLRDLNLGKKQLERAERNIGAALGCGKGAIKQARKLYDEAGVKLFRIYTISSDPHVIETAKKLRDELGDDIEIFVGQLSDKKQCLRLIEDDIKADALIFGHGGGMQCTSATNGMALTTLEEIYEIVTDQRFNEVTVGVEGGVGKSVGNLLILGVDLILSNQKFVKGTIELSDLYFQHKNGEFCHPYHGSASAPTMIIESINTDLMKKRMHSSGRAQKIEGKPGYMFYQEKSSSMAVHINEFKHYAARTLADLGVRDIKELREFLQNDDQELLRIISFEASKIASPHTTT